MRKSFLKSLVGKSLDKAEEAVKKAGFKCNVYGETDFIITIAIKDMVNLFHANKVITNATAGDPCELED